MLYLIRILFSLILFTPLLVFGQTIRNSVFEFKFIPDGNLFTHQLLYVNKHRFKYCDREPLFHGYGKGKIILKDSLAIFKFKGYKYGNNIKFNKDYRVDTFKIINNSNIEFIRQIDSKDQDSLRITNKSKKYFNLNYRLAILGIKDERGYRYKKIKKKIKNLK